MQIGRGINYFSYLVVSNSVSLFTSLTVSFTIEGCHAFDKVFSWKATRNSSEAWAPSFKKALKIGREASKSMNND